MRFTRYVTPAVFICTMILAPVSAPAAPSKEMLDLQRDIAQLQSQITDLQKSSDAKLSALQSAVQQALDTANKTNSSMNGLNTGIMQTVQNALRGVTEQLNSVTGLAQTVKGISDDVGNLQTSNRDMQVQLNKQGQMLTDILHQVQLMQAPAAAPPGADTASAAPGVTAPPPTALSLFTHAAQDQDGGRLDLALSGFKEFLRLYPNDPNAIAAQYNIGNIYYTKSDLNAAVTAFDAAIEQYPKSEATTPGAYYMKGMALKKLKKNPDAIASFRAVVAQFPHADEAAQAKQQLTSMGASPAPATKRGH